MRPEMADQPVCAVVERRARLIARGAPSARRHPDGAVEPDRLAVQHHVGDDVAGERGVLVRLAEPLRERHLLGERRADRLRQRAEQGRLEDSGRDRHHANAQLGEVACDGQGHAHDAALGRRVRRLADLPVERGHRGGVDDHAALAVAARRVLRHVDGREPDAIEGADQVHGDDARELLSFAGPDLPSVFMAVPMPAQFTSTLMAPSRARAASRAPATSSALVTSAGVNTAASPSDFATSAPGEAGRSRMAMRAPAPASRAAVARPRPDAPPVTTARTDASSMDDPPRRNGILGTDIMRTAYNPAVRRRILCVYPAYARSFGTFQHAYGFFGGRVRAFMPPQGLLAVAAYLPASWEVRFADENSCAASDDDFRWADAVFISGMHIQ